MTRWQRFLKRHVRQVHLVQDFGDGAVAHLYVHPWEVKWFTPTGWKRADD